MSIIIKGFEYESESFWTGDGKGRAYLALNDDEMTVDVTHLSGNVPHAGDTIKFILADKDVRRMIKAYQQSRRKHLFAIRCTTGVSGREDFYINFYDRNGVQIKGKKLMHVSQEGKLNEGWEKMYIGDLVELVAYIANEDEYEIIKDRKKLLRYSGCRYIKLYTKNTDDLTKKVSKIL